FEGRIAYEIAGENGFGYDPIFYVPEEKMTSAEMSPEAKNRMSHRGKALQQVVAALKELKI
ncbi:MAG: non-canonical purine NTP pyrophosphatase, partial [Lachnospiraceae bacterium]|nr:non-canonical purine NTP pyrophosphatase [Lachnospiraceae bacterium]